YYAILYQFICVPLLTIFSLLLYYRFIVVRFASVGGLVTILVTTILVLFNVAAIYGIAYLMEHVFKMPLINHIITGASTIFILLWLNVYFVTSTKSSCSEKLASALECGELINNSKIAMTALIACVTYFLLYIVIQRIVSKKMQRSNS
ncbi:MAG: hypothetical protein K2G03_02710, partial [Bacilli bacterium]|nr:hypothetical protein [Bacilli bacterium]